MPFVIGRLLGGTVVMLLAVLSATSAFAAATVPGARIAFGAIGPGNALSLMSTDPGGKHNEVLLRAVGRERPAPLYGLSWSADGGRSAFTALTGRLFDGGTRVYLLTDAGPQAIPNTEGATGIPVLSPDGATVAFSKARERQRVVKGRGVERKIVESAASVWTVRVDGTGLSRATRWQYGLEIYPSSFSPDGAILAATRHHREKAPSMIGLPTDGGPPMIMARRAGGGVFSPAGTKIAYLGFGARYTEDEGSSRARKIDIFVRDIAGGNVRRLTRSPRWLESGVSWDPSGERLAFVQHGTVSAFFERIGAGDPIVQMNSDGTCRSRVFARQNIMVLSTSWRPGPGREAGRIAC